MCFASYQLCGMARWPQDSSTVLKYYPPSTVYHCKDASKHHRFVRGPETIAAVPAHRSCGLMWRWNHYHMMPFFANEGWQHWCLSIIHGFFACSAETAEQQFPEERVALQKKGR